MYEVYKTYLGGSGMTRYQRIVENARNDLLSHAQDNPDYHGDTKRNGIDQPFILTRGGEQFTYNMICLPGDDLYAGDIIDAFNEKWIVMEARADATTHKTGVMHQCNHLFRFQNFTSDIVERWGYIDQSGYSSQVTGTNQMQKAEEQFAIYMSYDDETAKIFVDKRIASHVGCDKFGHKILVTFKVTSAAPNTFSYNKGDHLLGIKVIRDVYSETTDNLEEGICDYIAPGSNTSEPPASNLVCYINGASKLLLGRSRTYRAVFLNDVGQPVDDIEAVWDLPPLDGITYTVGSNTVKVSASHEDSLIGSEIILGLSDAQGQYEPTNLIVEVGNIV
nr:MAG TPA: head closure knob [Caudoviricetes sp.]